MIAPAHWRRGGPDGREPIAAGGEVVSLVKSYVCKREHWGKITSRPQLSRADLEYLAWRLGCKVSAIQQAINKGIV